jgi:serine-type D-Ala-D-Ala carboxypeptidase (penicillin-binding protein 5/6)
VLQPVRRRRRRGQRRRLRLSLVLLVVLIALGVGVVARGRHKSHPAAARAPVPALETAALPAAVRARERRPRLVFGPAVVRSRFALAAPTGIVIDARSGRVLWAKRPHSRRQVASTTKIMTALLALRRLRPHDLVTVPPEAPRVPLVREGLRTGERVQAWKLFYGLLLYSGNDDALALAVAAGGTKRRFIDEMNAEAKRLGLRDTHFASTSGVIDDRNYSSAWDLAALTRVAMRNVRFRSIVRRRRVEVPWSAPTFAKVYVNKNRLLSLYAGATGVKTGYTQRSGPCIVASATRRGVPLIAVVLDSSNEYVDAARLLSLGFRTASPA